MVTIKPYNGKDSEPDAYMLKSPDSIASYRAAFYFVWFIAVIVATLYLKSPVFLVSVPFILFGFFSNNSAYRKALLMKKKKTISCEEMKQMLLSKLD